MIERDQVVLLLRRAGDTLRRLPSTGSHLGTAQVQLEVASDPSVAYGYLDAVAPRSIPTNYEITLMDIVLQWLVFIPDSLVNYRLAVAHRMIWNEEKGRSVWSYRRLGDKLHTSHQSVKSWDEKGMDLIHDRVQKNNLIMNKISLYVKPRMGVYSGYVDQGALASCRRLFPDSKRVRSEFSTNCS